MDKLILLSPVGIPAQPEEQREGTELSKARYSVVGSTLPSWLVRLWNGNYTPQWFIRTVGPWGPKLVKRYTDFRFQYLPPEELKDLREYLYHISADSASGEYALAAMLEPGAWARQPLSPLLKDILMPTTFLYGDVDWMDARHAESIVDSMRVPTRVIRLPKAGHHLYLDNVSEFNQALLDSLRE